MFTPVSSYISFILNKKNSEWEQVYWEAILLAVVEYGANTLSRRRDLYRILQVLLFPPKGHPTGGSKTLNEHRILVVAQVLGRRRRSNRRATSSNHRGRAEDRKETAFDSPLAFIEGGTQNRSGRRGREGSSVYIGTKIYSLWYLTHERFIAVAVLNM